MLNQSSGIWIPVSKSQYNYSDGTTKAYYFRTTTNKWIGTVKEKLTQNSSGVTTNFEKYIWNEKDSLWLPSSKTEKDYNASSLKLNSVIESKRGSTNGWQAYFKIENECQTLSDNSIAFNISTNYAYESSSWKKNSYTQYYYTSKATSLSEVQSQERKNTSNMASG